MLDDFFTRTCALPGYGPGRWDRIWTTSPLSCTNRAIRARASDAILGAVDSSVRLTQHGQTMAEVSVDTLRQYLHSLRRSPAGKLPPTAQGVQHLMNFLQRQGVIPSPMAPLPPTDADQWLQRLRSVSGARARCGAEHTPELSPLRTALLDRAFWCQPDRLERRGCPGLRRLCPPGGGDETRSWTEKPLRPQSVPSSVFWCSLGISVLAWKPPSPRHVRPYMRRCPCV